MSLKLLIALFVTAALGAPVGYVFYQARFSPDNWTYAGGSTLNWKDSGPHGGSTHGVPGPLAAQASRSSQLDMAPTGSCGAIVASRTHSADRKDDGQGLDGRQDRAR